MQWPPSRHFCSSRSLTCSGQQRPVRGGFMGRRGPELHGPSHTRRSGSQAARIASSSTICVLVRRHHDPVTDITAVSGRVVTSLCSMSEYIYPCYYPRTCPPLKRGPRTCTCQTLRLSAGAQRADFGAVRRAPGRELADYRCIGGDRRSPSMGRALAGSQASRGRLCRRRQSQTAWRSFAHSAKENAASSTFLSSRVQGLKRAAVALSALGRR